MYQEFYQQFCSHRHCVLLLLMVVWTCGFGAFGYAQGTAVEPIVCEIPRGILESRPDPTKATDVEVGVYVIDIEQVDNVKQSFNADFILTLKWKDPRLARKPRTPLKEEVTHEAARRSGDICSFALDKVWHPHVEIWNKRFLRELLDHDVEVAADGTSWYTQRYYGTLSSPLNLRQFPFDQQRLPITLVSFVYGPDDMVMVFEDAGQSEQFSLSGWQLRPAETSTSSLKIVSSHGGRFEESYSQFQYTFSAHRDFNYYAWKVMVPLIVIVCMSWAVFWISPDQLGVQIGVASTSILTLIAFLFSLSSVLPPISYLTRMDFFVFSSLVLVFMAFGEAMLTCSVAAHDRLLLARRIDAWARWIFPLCFVFVLVSFLFIGR